MTRRVLAALGCTALALVLTVRAEPPTRIEARNTPKAEPKAVDASPDKAVGDVNRLSREYKQFEELLLRLTQRMEKSPRPEDRAKAEALRKAIDIANREGVENKFEKLLTTLLGKDSSRNLTTDDLEKAGGQNDELIKILKEMLDVLLTDSELLKKQQEAKLLEAMIKQINEQIQKEKRIQSGIDGGKVENKTSEKEQDKVTKATESIARQMGAKPNAKKDGKEGEAKDAKGDPKNADAKDDAKDPKSDQKDAKPGDAKDPKDSKSGDAKGGDPKKASDAKGGDPKQGGDSKSPPKPGDPKKQDQQAKNDQKPSDGKSKPENKADSKPSDSQGKPSDSQGKPSQGKPSQSPPQQQAQSKPNQDQQANNSPPPPNSQNPPPPDLPGKKQVQDANDMQKKVQDDLKKDKPQDASPKIDDVITKLEEAKKELEKRLKQLREEELERLLANLQGRCERMLAMQIEVYEGTKRVDAVVKTYPDQKPTRAEEQRSQQLSTREGEIVREANAALRLLESEGSAVAFAMVMESVRDDMVAIERRLDKYVTNESTQHMEEDVITALKDMIEALKKAIQDAKDKKDKPPPPPKQGPPPPQRLLDILAELKLIKSMQLQVNKRTTDNGKKYPGEQADDKLIQDELAGLAKKQTKLEEMLKDIATGKNK